MSGEVIPLRPRAPEAGLPRRRVVRQRLTYPEGMAPEAVRRACLEQLRMLERHEGFLSATLAKALLGGLPPVETWVGVILGSDADPAEVMVELGPREQAVYATEVWPAIARALSHPPAPGRLQVVVEAEGVVSLLSVDVSPALPVTRSQAQAMDLPAHLLFAKGEAFASVRDEARTVEGLLAAWDEHHRLVEDRVDDVLEDLRKAVGRHELAELAGVVLSLGQEGRAAAAVTRAQARKLVSHHPALARKLEEPARIARADGGSKEFALPIVVWAKGHVSVQSRDVVAWA
jgi:hypothetical protein